MLYRLFDRARAAAILAGLLALVVLALAASVGAARPDDVPARPVTVSVPGGSRIEEDDPGWDCSTMGNRVCGMPPALPVDCSGSGGCVVEGLPAECRGAGAVSVLCVTVASRPGYGWTNPDGSRVEIPDGRAIVGDLEEQPGTPGFGAALRALDAEWREHH
ncbi:MULTISPECIES: hypothetical protein [unclassified Streptomyces]|uniref:hypothetical protein n=1 Tax=unclassified Streptomyces TaxID=2593676 RepID=UPI0035E14725